MVNEELQDAVMTSIVLLRSVGVNIVLVHGGGRKYQICSNVSASRAAL